MKAWQSSRYFGWYRILQIMPLKNNLVVVSIDIETKKEYREDVVCLALVEYVDTSFCKDIKVGEGLENDERLAIDTGLAFFSYFDSEFTCCFDITGFDRIEAI